MVTALSDSFKYNGRSPRRLQRIQQHENIHNYLTSKQKKIRPPETVKTEHVQDCTVSPNKKEPMTETVALNSYRPTV
jgi:hypothetical protein